MGICNWPKILEEPKFDYDKCLGNEVIQRQACADGLMGWALCMSGNKPPENFGQGMVKISKILDVPAMADNLSEFAEKKGWITC